MSQRVLRVAATGDAGADDGALTVAAAVLGDGGTVILPTDTVYGLAALPTVPGATRALFALKGRGPSVPLAVLCADAAQAATLVDDADGRVAALGAAFWPGPLTIVAARRAGVVAELGDPPTTVGVRCPRHALVGALARMVGPVATTSANRHGRPTPDTALAAADDLLGDVDLVIDAGPCAGTASSVVELVEGGWFLRREGPLDLDALAGVLGAPAG